MPKHQRLAVLFNHRGRYFSQLLHQLIRELVAGKRQVLELLGISHPSRPVRVLYQLVFRHYLGVGHFLGRGKFVLDNLEDKIVTGQRKHAHHHALDTRCQHKLVTAAANMAERTAMKVGFAVLVVAHAAIDFRDRLGGHQALQK